MTAPQNTSHITLGFKLRAAILGGLLFVVAILLSACVTVPAVVINKSAVPETEIAAYIQDQKDYWEMDEAQWQEYLKSKNVDEHEYRLQIIQNHFVERLLADQLALAKKVSVSDDEIDAALKEAQGAYDSSEAFKDHLFQEGLSENGYRAELKQQLQIERINQTMQEQAEEEQTPYLFTYSDREGFLLEYAKLFCDAEDIESIDQIPADAVEKLDAMLAEQNKLQEEGKYFEGSLVCTEVVIYNEDGTVAWSRNSTEHPE